MNRVVRATASRQLTATEMLSRSRLLSRLLVMAKASDACPWWNDPYERRRALRLFWSI